MSLNNTGFNYFNQKKYTQAIKNYLEALDYNTNSEQTWYNLAIAYFHQQDFEKAFDALDQAMKICPLNKKQYYSEQRKKYEMISRSYINVKMIQDEKVRDMILSAESIILDHHSKSTGDNAVAEMIDYSMTLVQYSKALETMIHNHVSLNLWDFLTKKYTSHIEEHLWIGNSSITKLSNHVRLFYWSLRAKKTVTIGSWCKIFNFIEKQTNNPVDKDFNEFIEQQYTKEEIKTLRESCYYLNEHRGSSAHYDTKERETVLSIRSEYLSHLNKVIAIIYSEKLQT